MNANCFGLCLVIFCLVKISFCCSNDSASCSKIKLSSTLTEAHYLQSIRCHEWCIKKNAITLTTVITYPQWPAMNITDLESNCNRYQKVEQCQLGCIMKLQSPANTTVNNCRDKCYNYCLSSCNGAKTCPSNGQCPRKCRKTYCRKGCEYTLNSQETIPLSPPLVPPSLTPLVSSDYFYTVKFPTINVTAQHKPNSWVSFLFKVQDTQENITRYYWQTDLRQPLKLGAFACRHVDISMCVVNSTHKTPYSPSVKVCLSTGDSSAKKGFPSQVNADQIKLKYGEDRHHLGYATVNISWNRPQNYQAVTSYSIYLLSTKSICGGIGHLYTYEGIDKNTTEFMITAKKEINFPRFGCSYEMILKVYPSPIDTAGTQVTITPSLSDDKEKVHLTCSVLKIEEKSLINLQWSLSNYSIEGIDRFNIDIEENDITHSVTANATITRYNHSIIITDDMLKSSSISLTAVMNPVYYWRHQVIGAKCQLVLPPNIYLNVSAKFLSATNSITKFNVTWSSVPNSTTHVQLVTGYQSYSPPTNETDSLIIESSSRSSIIEVTNSKPVYLWIRSLQNETVSSWNKPILLNNQVKDYEPLCLNQSSVDEKLDKLDKNVQEISQYLNKDSYEAIKNRLDRIEQKLNEVLAKLNTAN